MNTVREGLGRLGAFLAMGALLSAAACYPDSSRSTAELDIVATFVDPTMNWAPVTSYHLPDSVIDIAELLDIDDALDLSDEFDDLILATIRTNLNGLGWEEVNPVDGVWPKEPDVAVVAGKLGFKNTGVGWGYPGYPWYPGWGWGPCYYCGGVYYTYSWDQGSVVMTIIDPDQSSGTFQETWLGGLNGVLSGSSSGSATRITNGINQAFTQSPYLAGN